MVSAPAFTALYVDEGTHDHDANAHMLTMPMHTADDSYVTILSASV